MSESEVNEGTTFTIVTIDTDSLPREVSNKKLYPLFRRIRLGSFNKYISLEKKVTNMYIKYLDMYLLFFMEMSVSD
jgi:hypothetical protein